MRKKRWIGLIIAENEHQMWNYPFFCLLLYRTSLNMTTLFAFLNASYAPAKLVKHKRFHKGHVEISEVHFHDFGQN